MAARGLAKQTCFEHRSCYRRHTSLPILPASRLAVFYQLLAIAACATPSIISSCKHSAISSSTQGVQEDTTLRRQKANAVGRASTNTGVNPNAQQGKFPLFNPSKTESMSTPLAKPSSAAPLSNSSFTDTAITPADVVTPGGINGKAIQPQWGLAAHTELNRLAFVPIDSVPAVTPNQSPILVTAPSLNRNNKQADQPSSYPQQSKISAAKPTGQPIINKKSVAHIADNTVVPTLEYPPSNSGFPTDRTPTMPNLINRVATTASMERKKVIRSGSLPDKYIQALRLAFDNSGYLHAIDNYGHLILNSDSGVNFASGSAEMTKSSRVMVQKLAKLYAETLLVELNDEYHTIHIAIKGYTNPRPDSNNTLTHNANRRISRKRAAMIRSILNDSKIWPNSNLSIDGRGEENPISREGNQVGPCGIYDCERSRRIELEATIK